MWRRKAAQTHDQQNTHRKKKEKPRTLPRASSKLQLLRNKGGGGGGRKRGGLHGVNAVFRASRTRSMASRWLTKTRSHHALPNTRKKARDRTRVQRRRSSAGDASHGSSAGRRPMLSRVESLGQHQAALRMRVDASTLKKRHRWGAKHVAKIEI